MPASHIARPAAPTAGDEPLAVGRESDGIDRLLGVERADVLGAEVHQAAPFPVAQVGRAFARAAASARSKAFSSILAAARPIRGDVGSVLFLLAGLFGGRAFGPVRPSPAARRPAFSGGRLPVVCCSAIVLCLRAISVCSSALSRCSSASRDFRSASPLFVGFAGLPVGDFPLFDGFLAFAFGDAFRPARVVRLGANPEEGHGDDRQASVRSGRSRSAWPSSAAAAGRRVPAARRRFPAGSARVRGRPASAATAPRS